MVQIHSPAPTNKNRYPITPDGPIVLWAGTPPLQGGGRVSITRGSTKKGEGEMLCPEMMTCTACVHHKGPFDSDDDCYCDENEEMHSGGFCPPRAHYEEVDEVDARLCPSFDRSSR